MKTLLGVLWFVVALWRLAAFARGKRRSGETKDYGHPTEDVFLLLASAILLVVTMLMVIWWMSSIAPHSGKLVAYLFTAIAFALGAGITYFSNSVLKHGKRKS